MPPPSRKAPQPSRKAPRRSRRLLGFAGLRRSLEKLFGLGAHSGEREVERLVVGLGNPGPDYEATRHNVGFRVVDAFAARHGGGPLSERFGGHYRVVGLAGRRVGLLEPQTFMNASGDSLREACRDLTSIDPARDLVVVYDDLDLPLGRIRVRRSGGAGGHRGMKSIIDRLGRSDVPRLRFGIGRPAAGEGVVDHVLAPFEADEEQLLRPAIERAIEAIDTILLEGVDEAMDRYNG